MISRGLRPSRTVLLLLLGLVAWITLGPTQLGGADTILVTQGTSMEPHFHSGDLAVLRRSSSYQVGDIIGYHLTAQTLVLHRIVGEQDGHFIMKGDNNAFLDPVRPDASQAVGKLWLHLPAIGGLLVHLHAPVVLILLMVTVGSAAIAGHRPPQTAAMRRKPRSMNRSGTWSSLLPASQREEALGLTVTIGLVALVATLIAFSRPTQQAVAVNEPYTQSGSYSYVGSAPGSIYTDDQVTTGEPVYLQLVRSLQVSFAYRFSALAPHNLQGSYRLELDVGQETGWKRSVELVPETPFQGDRVAIVGAAIPLDQVQSLATVFADQTGLKGSTFTVTVTPMITTHGTLAGAAVTEQFAPPLQFHMDGYQLVLDRPAGEADPLTPAQSGLVPRPGVEPNRFALLGVSISVVTARLVSLLLLVIASALALGLVRLLAQGRPVDEAGRIAARYGALLLQVRPDASRGGESGPVIDVLRIEDLAKLATQTGRMILHEQEGSEHRYLVLEGTAIYRFCMVAGNGQPRVPGPKNST